MENLNLNTKEETPKDFIQEIFKLGFKFMVIQLGMLFLFTSDNYIISNAFGPKEVVPYEVVNKIFQFPILILFATLSPLWSMFAKDYLDKNHQKLLLIFKQFNLLFIAICAGVIGLAFVCPYVIPIWIKEPIKIPKFLVLYITFVTLIRIFVAFYIFFLNGTGKLNKYIILLLLSVAIKIPLSYYFIGQDLGINSVVLSTLILMAFWALFIPYECYSLVNKLKK